MRAPRSRVLAGLSALGTVAALAAVASQPRGLAASPPPERCSIEVRRGLATSLIASFNAGDTRAVDRLVAKEPAFEWFSAGPGGPPSARRLGGAAYDRATLLAYVRRRHRHHERLALIKEWPGSEYFVIRQADDYPRRPVHGKMDAVCAGTRPRIIVWSTG